MTFHKSFTFLFDFITFSLLHECIKWCYFWKHDLTPPPDIMILIYMYTFMYPFHNTFQGLHFHLKYNHSCIPWTNPFNLTVGIERKYVTFDNSGFASRGLSVRCAFFVGAGRKKWLECGEWSISFKHFAFTFWKVFCIVLKSYIWFF